MNPLSNITNITSTSTSTSTQPNPKRISMEDTLKEMEKRELNFNAPAFVSALQPLNPNAPAFVPAPRPRPLNPNAPAFVPAPRPRLLNPNAPAFVPIAPPIPKPFYETNIIDPNIEVLSLSDIHGDMQSFMIAVRDLGNLVRKKKSPDREDDKIFKDEKKKKQYNLTHYKDFSQNTYDDNMEQILNLNLNVDEDIYIPDLNYEWCGENKHLVICGDIIDPNRTMECLKNKKLCSHLKDTSKSEYDNCLENRPACSYYPQIELKILMFINALNKQAIKSGGKIIKLLGNHELGNIFPSPEKPLANTYAFKKDLDLINNYYNNISRFDIFKFGQLGFKLLIEGGIGVLVKINNTIFVHGDLLQTYKYYDNLNKFINDPDKLTEEQWKSNLDLINLNQSTSSLWVRMRGDDEDASKRATARMEKNNNESVKFCKELVDSFTKFVGKELTDNVDDLKLVIGHCPQHYISVYGQPNVTYNDLIRSDTIKEVFGRTIYEGKPDFDRTDKRTKIFGITMECQIPKTNLHRLHRVDIGMSRGMDAYTKWNSLDKTSPYWREYNFPKNLEEENQFLYSKTPQILIINKDGTFEIAKSKMRNTRIHLPREEYEQYIVDKNIEELDYNTQSHLFYKQKYLKYKNKYLQLKQIIN
jgi:hypothetical protein